MSEGGFERGAGISESAVAAGFDLLLVIIMIVAAVMIILGAWGAWSSGQLKTEKLMFYSIRALVLLVVTVVLFGAVV